MVFEGLSSKLQDTLDRLKGKGKLTEKDVDIAMKEVRLALLEADVNFRVAKNFIKKVKDRCIGQEVMTSLTPGQQVIKIVNEELTELMGAEESKVEFSNTPPTVIMMCGLQGAGKTTTSAKLGGLLKKKGKRPLLVACDIYRPAAIKQLEVVGKQLDIPVFSMGDKTDPVNISKAALEHAKKNGNDLVIIDTAGRLHIDDELMGELQGIIDEVSPNEKLLVVDAMTGQDAVTISESFDEKLNITGVVLTKLDGDARGGAALSIRAVTGKPIKFIGVGEKLDQLEVFYPDRMASRILGMGDVLSLIEKAQTAIDEEKVKELEEKMRSQEFDFDDFLSQMNQVKKLGSMSDILGMIPGMGAKQMQNIDIDDKHLVRIEAMIQSMTPYERQNPNSINGSRRKRIAKGSGTNISEVNKLIKQFKETKKMMKKFTDMEKTMKKKGKFSLPFFK
ncbi:MAG: signal recognition particle protein [Andreesenia angusta]|nr:signal recognition particle protein [Andreesenia angusta]